MYMNFVFPAKVIGSIAGQNLTTNRLFSSNRVIPIH